MYQVNVFRGLTGKPIDRSFKMSLKMPKGQSDSVNRRTDNAVVKKKDKRTNTTNETKEYNTNPTKNRG